MYDGTQEVSFTYDANGMRKTKNTGSWTYTYTYNGSQLTQMTFLTSEVFYFTYDPQGHPATVKWNNHVYYYITNLQGDVIAIADQGVVVVEYKYDAWGKLLSITGSEAQMMGRLNPLRYRGYVYDQETGLYYLQSRYYNPEWGRFLNADALVSTGGLLGNNMFMYCLNNPIRYFDYQGMLSSDIYYATLGDGDTITAKVKGKQEWKSRKDPRHGSHKRKKSGERERNVGHPNGEEHSRRPKGNGMPIHKMVELSMADYVYVQSETTMPADELIFYDDAAVSTTPVDIVSGDVYHTEIALSIDMNPQTMMLFAIGGAALGVAYACFGATPNLMHK